MQKSIKRQRLLNIALLGVIVAGGFVAAVRPVGDATFDTITCKGWNVVDKDGKVRISASSNANGAGVEWIDNDFTQRIAVSTNNDGSAGVGWIDKEGKIRMTAATNAKGGGTMGMQLLDKYGKTRITAFTDSNENAGMTLLDKSEKSRIGAYSKADGSVDLPTTDLNPPKP